MHKNICFHLKNRTTQNPLYLIVDSIPQPPLEIMFRCVWTILALLLKASQDHIKKIRYDGCVDGLTGAGGYPAGFLSPALATHYPCKGGLFITALDH